MASLKKKAEHTEFEVELSDTSELAGVGGKNGQAGQAEVESDAEDPDDVEKRKVAVLHKNASQGNFDVVVKLAEASPELWPSQDDEGHSILHWASLCGDLHCVNQALAAGVAVDVPAKNWQTPFMWAVIKGRLAVAQVLLVAKADPRAKDSFGATPLTLAVQHGQHQMILLMMARGSKEKLLADRDNKGCAAIHWAGYKGDLPAIRLLNYFDADLSMLDDSKMTPLHRAAQAVQADACVMLIQKGVSPSARDSEGKTAMDIAEQSKDKNLIRALQKFVDPRPPDNKKEDDPKQDGAMVIEDAGDVEAVDGSSSSHGSKGARSRKEDHKRWEDTFKKAAQRWIAPTFWLVSVSIALFQYLTDLRTVAWERQPYVAMGFELGVPLSLALFVFCHLTDPGKVPPRMKGASAVEEILRALSAEAPSCEVPDLNRLCTTTWVLKGLRTKYCTVTEACVQEFDHFCGWLNVAIGRNNHRPFIFLGCVEVATQFSHLYLCWVASRSLVNRETMSDWVIGVVLEYPLLAGCAALHTLTAPGIFGLVANHLRMIALNMTTNEVMNAHRYEHFWTEVHDATTGKKRKAFRNPFDKGSMLLNCIDFWWMRRRGECGPNAARK